MNEKELNEFRKMFNIQPFISERQTFDTLARYFNYRQKVILHNEKEVQIFLAAMKKFKKKVHLEKIDDNSYEASRI